ncbi:phage baseplate assembly protein V [Portibacter marinus]|uniref:phage baseplate assembly protein V n=1 Tax=Portibacter marinus TaxID=2898660 RepID=UPI001F3B28BA|nr:phage baseplate assembly protein V [Portibacter marinus]
MPASPLTSQEKIELTSYEVKINGQAVPDEFIITYISVSKALNKIATAKIQIEDGTMHDTEFKTIEENKFKEGDEVEIQMGYGTSNDSVFKGIIVKHGIKISSTGTSHVFIECADKSIVLTGQREFKIYEDIKDSDVIKALASDKSVPVSCSATNILHERVVQQNCTAWDFIVTRAQANYLVVYTLNNELKIVKPSEGAKTDAVVEYGLDIISMDLSVDARTQLLEVETSAWDYTTQQNVTGKSKEPSEVDKLGNIKGKDIAGKLQFKKSKLHSTGYLEGQELEKWAESTLLISRLSRVRGTVKFRGFAKINPNDFLKLEQVSPHFSGEAYVTGVYHEEKDGDWITEVEVGLKPELFISNKNDVTLPLADGLFPGYQGLFIGKVLDIVDPKGEARVLVKIPMLGGDIDGGVWARVSNIMASRDFGSVFFPEVDDEVILGALGGDLRFPVILGHLYSSVNYFASNDFIHTDENNHKGWKTREGLLLHFDDKDKIVRVETPAGQKIKLDDREKSITLEDQHSNKMVMDSSGFKFTGNKDFVVDVKGKVNMDSMQEMALESKMTFSAKGGMSATMQNTAGSKFEAGTIGATMSSSAIATIKGSVVMIN